MNLISKLLLAVLLCAATPLHAQLRWTPDVTSIRPPAGDSYEVVTTDNGMLLFGGHPSAQTWTYQNGTWSRLNPTTEPPARRDFALAWHSGARRAVLFGGRIPGQATPLDDTWIFDGTTWTRIDPSPRPPARSAAAMAYDSHGNRLVLFGGIPDRGPVLGDTWSWSGFRWRQDSPATTAPGRRGHAMVSRAGTVWMFGGRDPFGPLDDTWFLATSGQWIRDIRSARPPARFGHSLSWDADRQRIVMHGGDPGGSQFFDDTWELDETGWRERTPAGRGPAISDHTAGYDPATREVVLFGGAQFRATPSGGFVRTPVDVLTRYAPGTRGTTTQLTTGFCGGYQTIRFRNQPLLGNQSFRFDVPIAPAFFGAPFIAFFGSGFAATPLRLGPCDFHLQGTVEALVAPSRFSPAFQLAIPDDPALRGVQLHLQVAGPEVTPFSGHQRLGLSPTFRLTVGD